MKKALLIAGLLLSLLVAAAGFWFLIMSIGYLNSHDYVAASLAGVGGGTLVWMGATFLAGTYRANRDS